MKVDFTLFLIVFLVAAIVGWDWRNLAKIMPVYVAALKEHGDWFRTGLGRERKEQESGRAASKKALTFRPY